MAEPLSRGNVRAQLEERLEDPEIAADLMRRFHLPEWTNEPCWLQIPLNGELWSDYIKTRHLPAPERQRELARRVVEWLRRRTA